MYELIQIGKNTYYIKSENNVGIYKISDNEIFLIDCAMNGIQANKILEIINKNNWVLKGIINTHAHADHIGNNKILQDKTGCKIYSSEFESHFIKYTVLEPAFIYGAYPPKRIQKKFLMAIPTEKISYNLNELPKGLEIIKLPGHSYDMIGIKTDDDIYFIADSLFPIEALNTYHIPTIYNIEEFLYTLEYLKTLKGKLFIPTHEQALTDITELIQINENKIKEELDLICKFLKVPLSLNMITKKMFDYYNIEINFVEYNLVEGTIKAMLSYLIDKKKIDITFKDNFLLYKLRK